MAKDDGAKREATAEAAIRGTFNQVKAWRSAARFEPLAGTELATDNTGWLPLPLTESVCLSLDFASEQLDQVGVLVESGNLSLTSQRVLIRTALVSASIALWIVCPDEPGERGSRHRSLIEQNTYRHQQALKKQVDLELASGQPVQPNLMTMLGHVDKRLAEIQSLRASFSEKAQWNDTSIIRNASKVAFGKEPNPDGMANEAVYEFMLASSASHGMPWGLFNAVGTEATPSDADGRALMTLAPSYGALVNGYMAAYWISVASWRYLVKRGR